MAEHRCEAPRLCVNNCGFFGSPATQNLCSRCYRDLQLEEQESSNAKLAFNQTLPASSPSPSSSQSSTASSVPFAFPPAVDDVAGASVDRAVVAREEEEEDEKAAQPQPPNRCFSCRKRVGLLGIKCRCGMVFCGSHRYPEQHDCGFDFKSLGKRQIAKANPVVKAQKLDNKI